MKKSIGDNLLPASFDISSGLNLIRSAGFDGVELWLGAKPWFLETISDADIVRLHRQILDAGLAVSNVANTLDWDRNVASADPAVRAAAIRHVERQIEAAQLLGTDAILIVAGIVTPADSYNDVYARAVEALQKLGQRAAAAHVRIGVENCCSEQRFLLSPREFRTFLDDVGSPAVGLHLDVGNIHDTGFPEQWIRMHGARITRVHMKDVLRHRGRCGEQSVYTNIFLGDNDWKAVRAAFTEVAYDGWLIAEMESRYRFAADQQFYDTSAALTRFISGRL